ncbi:P-loop NTPase fold protein [Leadbetterella sp. DM7]|uniref:P-loop NTPase fold protein n=1 Tax=Leadbetterella sp. DM7 TaxID=3235085 RepID=UPI00349EF49B
MSVTEDSTKIKSPIEEPVINYLNMRTSGALLVTGNWGSGKTYHLKKYVFPLIKSKTDFLPIMVSLYGETDKSGIARKVFFEYANTIGGNVKFNTASWVKVGKNIAEAIPLFKKYVDINKLIAGAEENLFRFLPSNKLLICFDDFERMSEKIKPDDFLGLINDLVENKGCKVLVVTNETKIGIAIEYKEKTIERTIHFSPDLSEILNEIIKEYPQNDFSRYLDKNKIFLLETLTVNNHPGKKTGKDLKESLSNIRTLKFALDHFRIVFEILITGGEVTELQGKQLKNIWIFILSISIEFRKPKNISYEDKQGLDTPTSEVIDFDFSQGIATEIKDISENAHEEVDMTFSNGFRDKYYKRFSEQYIYYDELYSLITAGKTINKEVFNKNLEESFKISEGQINPAHEILSSLMRDIWEFGDTELKTNLNELLKYYEEGVLEDIPSYLNATLYFTIFKDIIGVNDVDIVTRAKKGLDIFFERIKFSNYNKYHINTVLGSFDRAEHKPVIEYINEKLRAIDLEKEKERVSEFKQLFDSDFLSFVDELSIDRIIDTPSRAELQLLETEKVKSKMLSLTPKEAKELKAFVSDRYLKSSDITGLVEELLFLENLKKGISERDFSQKTFTNKIIEEAIPVIEKAEEKLSAAANAYLDTEEVIDE